MSQSARPTVAVHVLTLLASLPGEALTSEFIASSVNTNPVVIRRVMANLRRAGYVRSQPGSGGGWQLVVPPKSITLADVRRAVEEPSPLALHSQPPNPACPVGRGIQKALTPLYEQATRAMEDSLARTTIDALLRSVLRAK